MIAARRARASAKYSAVAVPMAAGSLFLFVAPARRPRRAAAAVPRARRCGHHRPTGGHGHRSPRVGGILHPVHGGAAGQRLVLGRHRPRRRPRLQLPGAEGNRPLDGDLHRLPVEGLRVGRHAPVAYYGAVNTAVDTGQIIGIPNDFVWGKLVKTDGGAVALTTLVDGPSHGVWEAGIACATTHGRLADHWNTQVTFTADARDAHGFAWHAVPGAATASVVTAGHGRRRPHAPRARRPRRPAPGSPPMAQPPARAPPADHGRTGRVRSRPTGRRPAVPAVHRR